MNGKPLFALGGNKERLFNSTEELNAYLDTPKAKAGQFVEVLERNKLGQSVYQVYVLQEISGSLIPQKVSSDVDFTELDLKIVDDENDETKKYLVLGDDNDDETEYARVILPAMGSGSVGYIAMRLRNLLSSNTFTVPYNETTGCNCEIAYSWSSIDTGDNNASTGNGTAYYYVDGTLVLTTQNLVQGNVTIDLGSYLTPNRTNVIKATVVDSENNKKSLTYNVNVSYNYITTTFPVLSVQKNNFSIPVVPVGSGNKTIYCKIDNDNNNVITLTTRASSSTVYIDINNLTHGGHTFEIYMATILEGLSEPVASNTITLGVAYIDDSSNNNFLFARAENTSIRQYSYAELNFVVDDNVKAQSNIKCDIDVEVEYSEDNNTYDSVYTTQLNVDSGVVSDWSYRVMKSGYYHITLSYGDENPVTQTIAYEASEVDVAQSVDSGLQFLFDPMNRSNNESAATKNVYTYTNSGGTTYNVTFNNIDFNIFGWTGNSLKIPLGGSMTIPYQPFLTDVDTTKGRTIEMCFKIKNVYDYEQNVITCYANNEGIQVTANKGSLSINASDYVEASYNDETEVRLSFVITKRDTSNNNRGQLVYVFINSDIAGVIGYSELDRFVQNPATNITIGSEYAEIEVYKVRCYDIALFEVGQNGGNRSYDILNNYIADSPNIDDMIARNARNDIFDENNDVDYNKLPDNLPYMVIECEELPQYKGDKKTVSGYYVDKAHPEKSFTFENAEWNVQGTSSQGYYVKNFKGKFKGGIKREIDIEVTFINGDPYLSASEIQSKGVSVTSENPTTVEQDSVVYYSVDDTNITIENDIEYITEKKYKLYSDSVPTNAFCLKADVASSEGANNVVLMKIWDDMTRWLDDKGYDTLTPAQQTDSRVRQTIDGKPIVVYWKNTNTGAIKFWGKYNFNNDKGTAEVFGFTDDENHNCQSWEFKDNGLALTEFKDDDFDTIVQYTDKYTHETSMKPKWWIAFEARFPEDFEDTTKLKRVVSWVASTNPDTATNNAITSVTIDGTTYTTDSATYRIAKFKAEFESYFKKDLTLLYYIFTDIFLMVDSRAKNQFITTFDGVHWFFIPYDGDTALGIDNIGALNFGYWLEDDSLYNGSNVYNGQDSVLWKNVRAVFQTEIASMLNSLVSKGFTYEYVKGMFDIHQAPWSEAVFCADTETKYIKPYFETGTVAYLAMAQGSKALQRDYWLKHRFSYYFSKYMVGTAVDSKNEIQMRMTTPQGQVASYRPVDNPTGNPSTSYYYEKVGTNAYALSSDTEVDENKTYYVDNKTVVVTPFTNTYVLVEFGSGMQPPKYCDANKSVSFQSTLDSAGDSMFNIYNGAEIKSFGDLSAAYIKRFELGNMATNLETAIVGSEAQGYVNEGLVTNQFSLGNSQKLKVVNVSNCPNLGGNINVSQCYNIREILAKGSKITSVSLPSGSQLRTLKLPNTIVALSLVNQVNLTTFEMEGYDYLTSLTVKNTPIDIIQILTNADNLSNIEINDIDWTFDDGDGIELLDMLANKSTISSNTVNVTGQIHVPVLNSAQKSTYEEAWHGLRVTCTTFIEQFPIVFKNYDNSVLATIWVNDGDVTYDYIEIDDNTGAYYLKSTGQKLFDKPTKPYSWNKTYAFENIWDRNLTTRVREAGEYVAQFTETDRVYNVQFKVGNVIKQSIDVTAGDTVAYNISNGKPNKEGENNTWYLCKGWTDTGEEIYRSSVDVNHIYGLYSTLELNESMLSDFVATVPTVVKPTFVLNAIFDECGLPDGLPQNPKYEDVRAYLANYDYVYTNDPNYTSAYTLPELHAISMSDKFNLYLEEGDKMRIYFPSNGSIGGDIYGSGHDVAIMEVLGFNVYEREDSDFGEYNGTIIGAFTSTEDVAELASKQAGLYICNSNGNVYYWDGTALIAEKVTQYFSHVVWGMALGDNAANNASGKKYRNMMDTQFRMNSSDQTINGWGDDNASTNKKCELNARLNDGLSGGSSIFSTFPSELQPIITPVKVISAKGAYYPEGSSSLQFSPAPVTSVSRLFISCHGELWGTTGTPYINEINKWASICERDSSNNVTKINRYPKIVSNNALIARKFLGTGTDALNCWTRSAYSTTNFVFVGYNTGGYSYSYNSAGVAIGVPLCFCTG